MENTIFQDMEFIIELDRLKTIKRKTSLIHSLDKEDDAQHSWHVATMALFLSEYADCEIDQNKVIQMLLIHDLVEIYAGDTFCYDAAHNQSKKLRETDAMDRLCAQLDEKKALLLRNLWIEFEEMETKEALFAASIDRLQPMLHNYRNGGGTWKQYEITTSQIYERISPVRKISSKLWEFVEFMVNDAKEQGYLKD